MAPRDWGGHGTVTLPGILPDAAEEIHDTEVASGTVVGVLARVSLDMDKQPKINKCAREKGLNCLKGKDI